MKLISWNVNGYRAALSKGAMEKLVQSAADVIVLQETKAQPEQIDTSLFESYYSFSNSADKKGYSGTLILSKEKPISVTYGINIDQFDHEGRVITCEYEHCYIVCVYVPNSQNELVRLDYRQNWDKAFTQYLHQLALVKPVLVGGDFNVAHTAIDLKNPKSNERNAGYTIEERNGFTDLLNAGFIDSYRFLHPDTIEYSWWSYRFNARSKNIGWRIDYWLVSESIKDKINRAWIHTDWLASDHAPIGIEVNL